MLYPKHSKAGDSLNPPAKEELHYLMPLRNMSYDVAEYERQASHIRRHLRGRKGLSRSEFLSGFTKIDKLTPCITLVLYYGKDWDGSTYLHGLLDMENIPDEIKPYINNYSLHLIEVRKLKNTDVFQTDLKQIFDFIRYSEDKTKLREVVEADELLQTKQFHGKAGKVNMCKAIQEILADEQAVGHEQIVIQLYQDKTISLEKACALLGIGADEFLSKIHS